MRILKITAPFSLLLMSVLSQCSNPIKTDITKIAFATGYCHGECAFEAFEIDQTLAVKFYGGEYSDKKGYYKGSASKILWDTLTVRLARINVKALDTAYYETVDDAEAEFIIYYGNKKKHIRGQTMSMPAGLAGLYEFLLTAYKHTKLESVRDTLKFETTVQKFPTLTGPPMFLQ